MDIIEYEKLLANEEVNNFFNKLHRCWESLEETNANDKETAKKEMYNKLNSSLEDLKLKQEKIKQIGISEDYVDLDISRNSFFDTVFIMPNNHRIIFDEEDIEYIREYITKNESSNIEVQISSPAEIRYTQSVKMIKKLQRQKKSTSAKKAVYDKLDNLFEHTMYFYDKWDMQFKKKEELSDKINKINSDQRKMEFFKGLTFEQFKILLDSYDSFIHCKKLNEEFKALEKEIDKTMYISKEEMYDSVLHRLLENEIITQEEIKSVKFQILNFLLFKNEELVFPNRLAKGTSIGIRGIMDLFISCEGLNVLCGVFAKEVYNVSIENKDKILSKVFFKN